MQAAGAIRSACINSTQLKRELNRANGVSALVPTPLNPRGFPAEITRKSVALFAGTPICSCGLAYRRVFINSTQLKRDLSRANGVPAGVPALVPNPLNPWDFRVEIARESAALSVGTPLCPYGLAYRGFTINSTQRKRELNRANGVSALVPNPGPNLCLLP